MSAPLRSEALVSRDGARLALHHLGGTGPAALFVHGTSFHAHVLHALARRLPFQAFGLDLRGHGASTLDDGTPFVWSSLGSDVAAALDALAAIVPGPVYGIGHSAGATALLFAAGQHPERFADLYCYEPIAFTPEVRASVGLSKAFLGAARRRSQFSSKEEALAYFGGRPPLSGLDPEVLGQYVEHGLVARADGGVALACRPEYEAAVYVAGYEADAFAEPTLADCPATIAYGASAPGIGPACAPLVAAALPHGTLVTVEGLGHLGPLVDPARVARSIITAFETPAA